MYLYTHGKTKIPLNKKYFKFRSYILIEIFKVALPNILDDAIWTFTMSFVNGILLVTMGEIGPILYSVSNKLRTLLTAPARGFGRGLMSVTGHLFGAEHFDELEEMFNYVLKVSVYTTLVLMIIFFFIRTYAFSLFSIVGMDDTIFWISAGGIIIVTTSAVSRIASKMLDGFGKSLYSLLLTIIKVAFECILIYFLAELIPTGYPVLIGITIAEIFSSIVYYWFLKRLFRNFNKEYEFKYTVKAFTIKRKDKREIRREKIRQAKAAKKEEFHKKMEEKKQEKEERKEEFHKKMEEKKEKRENK